MRPQQQNRRMRGRNNNNSNNNNNNRKGNQNPLSRSYESNGPDVKIRGNAQQIAEKYTTLARDAMSSGDRVMAENYLQHAEHYNRIIAAAQAQMPIQNQQNRDDFDDEEFDERDDGEVVPNDQPHVNGAPEQLAGAGPQPEIEGVPAEVALSGEANGGQEPRRRENFRNRDRNRDGRDRNRGEGRGEGREFRRREGQGEADDAEVAAGDSLPAFVTQAAPQPAPAVEAAAEPAGEAEAPRRTRRPRRGEPKAEAAGEAESSSPAFVQE